MTATKINEARQVLLVIFTVLLTCFTLSVLTNFRLFEDNKSLIRENENLRGQNSIFVYANQQIKDVPKHEPRGI